MSAPEIVGIGANVCDTLICVPHYPTEDTKLRAEGIKMCGGGPCATGLVAAAKLGSRCAYIGALAGDAAGHFLMEDMKRFGLCCDYVTTVPDATSFSSYILLSGETGSRTCVFSKSHLPAFTLGEAEAQAIRSARMLMVDGNELENAIRGAEIARAAGVPVLYDAGGRYEGIERLLPLSDILIPSEEFALGVTGCDSAEAAAVALMNTWHPRLVIVTQGVRGGVLYDGTESRRYPAFPVTTVDSNGAGDVFHGACANALTGGMDAFSACIFASAVSALKCTRLGARDGVPGYPEVITFLKEKGYEF